jgi:hypothetical protein
VINNHYSSNDKREKNSNGEMNMKIMMMAAAAFLTAIAISVGLKELTG